MAGHATGVSHAIHCQCAALWCLIARLTWLPSEYNWKLDYTVTYVQNKLLNIFVTTDNNNNNNNNNNYNNNINNNLYIRGGNT